MSEIKKEKEVPIVMIDGIPCINLDVPPIFPRKVQKFFPFSQIQNKKQKYFLKVLDELKKRKPVAKSIVPFDIFIIDFDSINFKTKPKKENEDDCESE